MAIKLTERDIEIFNKSIKRLEEYGKVTTNWKISVYLKTKQISFVSYERIKEFY